MFNYQNYTQINLKYTKYFKYMDHKNKQTYTATYNKSRTSSM
jgi:hypothetical protein